MGIFIWTQEGMDGYPPEVFCVIEAMTQGEAFKKAEEFAEYMDIDPPEYGDVVEIYEHDQVNDVYKT